MIHKKAENVDILNEPVITKGVNKIFYALLLILYAVAIYYVGVTSRSSKVIMLMNHPLPLPILTGVLSSIANICLIMIVVLFGNLGFYTALALLIIDFPTLLRAIFVRHAYTSIPGIFTITFSIISIIVVFLNNKKIERVQKILKLQAVTDSLTGLPNRLACYELMDKLIKAHKKFAIVMIDINNFKNINDTMGHNNGNKILIEVAKRWKNAAASGLSGNTDYISRQGGDEFILVIQDYSSEEDVLNTIKYYESTLEERIKIKERDYYVSASFGYSEYPLDSDSKHTLISYADTAMYEIKRSNTSNHILKFTPDLIAKGEKEVEIENKIRTALKDQTFFFQLQPQFDINHNLRGSEALARMKDAEDNYISPADFVPVAEKVGLVDKIDSFVIKNSAIFFSELLKRTHSDLILSVNVSVRHLIKEDFIQEIKNVLNMSGLAANQLEIEITESIMLDAEDKALSSIRQLKNLGIRISIDDFGTGYSSLSYLNKIPADVLKIDKSFIDKMDSSSASKQYVATIISIGHLMNFEVVSEGVEHQEQLESLREIGCDLIQGFIWGKPMLPDAVEELVCKDNVWE